MNRISFALFVAGLIFASSFASAIAADHFDKVPALKGQRPNGLAIRIVKYAGSTNGAITVEVQNPTAEPQEFSAKGLYFVPQGNANAAPQRLGAVGPFQVLSAGGRQRADRLTIAPGASERLALDVYCIDSHRASPGPSTPFRIAKDRVPPALTTAIDKDANDASKGYGGVSAPAAKSAVQGQVWKNRDAKWIELEGEGKQEAGKKR
jgi:hypothetical protein